MEKLYSKRNELSTTILNIMDESRRPEVKEDRQNSTYSMILLM